MVLLLYIHILFNPVCVDSGELARSRLRGFSEGFSSKTHLRMQPGDNKFALREPKLRKFERSPLIRSIVIFNGASGGHPNDNELSELGTK
uniref:Putative secreted protein n=1 Tax=Rhipicephalus microplus TaxID=6941 RepID=A0A6M2DCU1_RHIMP